MRLKFVTECNRLLRNKYIVGLRFYNLTDLAVLAKKTPVKKEESSSDESSSDEEETKPGTKIAAIKKGGKSKIKLNHNLEKTFSKSRLRLVFKKVCICRIEINMCEKIIIRVFLTELFRYVHYIRNFALSYAL